ncbi:hypothetical protein C1N70_18480 [Cytobacillus firmus]
MAVFARFNAFYILFTELIAAEGAISSKMHLHFLRAVFTQWGLQCPVGAAGQVRPGRRKASGRLTASPGFPEQPGAEISG